MKKNIFALVLLFVFFACNTDVDVVIPRPEQKIEIAGFFNPDSLFIVLTENKYIFDFENYGHYIDIQNAVVSIYENDKLISNIVKKELNRNLYPRDLFYYTASQLPEEGVRYKLEVTAPGYPSVISETYIPKGVSFTADSWVSGGYLDIKINFTDPVEEKNFYILELRDFSGLQELYTYFPIECEDPIVDVKTERGQLLFTDYTINGKAYSMLFKCYPSWYDKTLTVRLLSLSEDLYKYFISVKQWNQNNFGGFSESVIVYSNIKGGIGIFGGYSYRSIEIPNPFYEDLGKDK